MSTERKVYEVDQIHDIMNGGDADHYSIVLSNPETGDATKTLNINYEQLVKISDIFLYNL